MKTCIFPLLVIAAALFGSLHETFAQGTAFTYQGRLNDGPNPTSGTYDLQFAVFDAFTAGGQQGVSVTNAAVGVTNGLFTVTLDFGGQFPGAARWLEIAVRTNGAATFTTLAPRQKLTPTPYAITASNLTGTLPVAQLSGQVNGAQIASGAVGSGQIDNTTVQARITGTATAGQFITGINANGTVTTAADTSDWKLDGNNISPGQFLGSTNNQAVELKANGQRVLRLEPGANGAPNVIAGSSVNYAAPGLSGVVIAGGGTTNIGGATYSNTVQASYANIGGGAGNTIEAGASATTIGGGLLNDMQYGTSTSVIGGGSENLIQTNSDSAVIGGGQANGIHPDAWGSAIGGGEFNHIYDAAHQSVIGGGNQNSIASNSVQSVVSGGAQNSIGNDSAGATIGGGQSQTIGAGAGYSTIAGGSQNLIQSNAYQSTIGGGLANHVESDAINSTIGGGSQNFIKPGAYDGFIGGGEQNVIQDEAGLSTIAGGVANAVQTNSTGSAIGGGSGNLIQPNNSYSTISGGSGNTSIGAYGTVAGGDGNVAGQNSFAAGHRARAVTTGAFVWADSQEADFSASANNQFLIRAGNGVGINTTNPQSALHVNGTVTATDFSGGASSLTTLNASQLTSGTVPSARLSGTYGNAVTLNNAANIFTGNGSALTSLNAGNLSSGTVADARLSSNIPKLGANQTFSGINVFNAPVGINTNSPGATLDVNGSLRVGNGTTIINNLQAGIAQMATGSDTVRTNFTFTFPKAFSSVPNVVISALNGNVSPVDDTFAVSVRDLTATTCSVNIVRVDNPSGWSQHVKINWIAWQ